MEGIWVDDSAPADGLLKQGDYTEKLFSRKKHAGAVAASLREISNLWQNFNDSDNEPSVAELIAHYIQLSGD